MSDVIMNLTQQDFKSIESDALIVGFFEDIRPLKGTAGLLDWLLCGALSRLLIEKRLAGKIGDVALLTSRGKLAASKVFLVGCGPHASFSTASLRSAAREAAAGAVRAGAARAVVEYLHPDNTGYDESVAAFRAGLSEGAGGRDLAVTVLVSDNATFSRFSQSMQSVRQASVS